MNRAPAKHTKRSLASLALPIFLAGSALGQEIAPAVSGDRIEIVIENGECERNNVLVEAPVMVPNRSRHFPQHSYLGAGTECFTEYKTGLIGEVSVQLSRPRLGSKPNDSKAATPILLTMLIPRLEPHQTLRGTIELPRGESGIPADPLIWRNLDDRLALRLARDSEPKQPLVSLEYPIFNESSPEAREATYKPFHHVYAPGTDLLITKGPGGKYTHHRGLFYGFNKVSYGDGKTADVWHCKGDAYQSIGDFEGSNGGSLMGRKQTGIRWHGEDKELFANELREISAYELPGGSLIEFVSLLRTTAGPVKLDGDPQHAGFHFRANNEVAEHTADQTYFLRPDGKGKLGETRNWPDDKRQVNLPWNAMSFVLGGNRYTVLYLDHPSNPKEARYSEREYGRFGSYFEWELTDDRPLLVRYRIWLQQGEMTQDMCESMSRNFVDPPKATAIWIGPQ